MRYMPVILVAALLASTAPASAQQSQPSPSAQETFLLGLSDIPLMPGLVEDEAAALVFDKPAGRIIIAHLGGCVDLAAARTFYESTLPQLGWALAEDQPGAPARIYFREGERLVIEFAEDSGGGGCLELRFLLSPAP